MSKYSTHSAGRGYGEQKVDELMRTELDLIHSRLGNPNESGDYFLHCKMFEVYFKASRLYQPGGDAFHSADTNAA